MAAQELHQTQRQTLDLRQKLAPQMQQSLSILQATALELNHLVSQELEGNPVLEEEPGDKPEEKENPDNDDGEAEDEFTELSQLDDDWRDHMQQSRSSSPRDEEQDRRRQHMMDSLVEVETLSENLLAQLATSEAEGEIRELALMLIGNLDQDGFLAQDIEGIALENGLPLPRLQEAMLLLQSFHPVGVAAQDLRECLLIQLQKLGKSHSLEYRIVDRFLNELSRKHYPQIARRLSVSPEQITAAAEMIATLNPKPGSEFSSSSNNQFITPDISVERDGNNYLVVIHNDHVPHLRISNTYKDIMSGGEASPEVKDYIIGKIRSGKFLIKCIHQRQDTIRRIAEEIVKRQRDFLDKGVAHLHPMNMAQIAEVVGVHETTVSRAIAGKYIATPRGVFEMKYFFRTGYETEAGEAMSNTSVKQEVYRMVKSEDSRSPLSDDKIVRKLSGKGIKIARRTVAKYRDEIGILPSHLRRSY
ncbi:MAG: RNA polymerase factor sigma-54 [Verrucomicrobiaceae bacterium]|nr:RNA polymerase factor sigma-54 [Verrucomicrobiaceae bacterium]